MGIKARNDDKEEGERKSNGGRSVSRNDDSEEGMRQRGAA